MGTHTSPSPCCDPAPPPPPPSAHPHGVPQEGSWQGGLSCPLQPQTQSADHREPAKAASSSSRWDWSVCLVTSLPEDHGCVPVRLYQLPGQSDIYMYTCSCVSMETCEDCAIMCGCAGISLWCGGGQVLTSAAVHTQHGSHSAGGELLPALSGTCPCSRPLSGRWPWQLT